MFPLAHKSKLCHLDAHSVMSNIVLRREVSNHAGISAVHCAPRNDSQKLLCLNNCFLMNIGWKREESFILKPGSALCHTSRVVPVFYFAISQLLWSLSCFLCSEVEGSYLQQFSNICPTRENGSAPKEQLLLSPSCKPFIQAPQSCSLCSRDPLTKKWIHPQYSILKN